MQQKLMNKRQARKNFKAMPNIFLKDFKSKGIDQMSLDKKGHNL